MRMLICLILGVLLLAASRCPAGEADPAGKAATRTESLRETELAFAASVQARDLEAFAAFLAEDAVFVGSTVMRGKSAIVEAWQVFFQPDGPTLVWWPEVVELAGGGDLGLTRGPYEFTTMVDGEAQTSSGLFNSVWRRREDGTWSIVFDAGCDP